MPHFVECLVKIHKYSHRLLILVQSFDPFVKNKQQLKDSRSVRQESKLMADEAVLQQVFEQRLKDKGIKHFANGVQWGDWTVIRGITSISTVLKDGANGSFLPLIRKCVSGQGHVEEVSQRRTNLVCTFFQCTVAHEVV